MIGSERHLALSNLTFKTHLCFFFINEERFLIKKIEKREKSDRPTRFSEDDALGCIPIFFLFVG